MIPESQEQRGKNRTDKMIIPIRCQSCGKPVGHLWEKYNSLLEKGTKPKDAMDKLGLERYCCRTLFLGHVELLDTVAQFKRS